MSNPKAKAPNATKAEDEEPVAYLGGQAAAPDGPVEGMLGGDVPAEDLPALPAAGISATYAASDFIAAPEEIGEDNGDAPTATVDERSPEYDTYAAEAPPIGDEPTTGDSPTDIPTDQPTDVPTQFEQYEQSEPPPTDNSTQTVLEAPPMEQSSEFDEPGLPKTISQQDAENIIKRITTKKILPLEQQAADRASTGGELTPRPAPKFGLWIGLAVILVIGAAATVIFRDQIGPYLPEEIARLIGYEPPKKIVVEPGPPPETPEQRLERLMRESILDNEARAFDYKDQDRKALLDKLKPGGGAQTPQNPQTPGSTDPQNGGKPK